MIDIGNLREYINGLPRYHYEEGVFGKVVAIYHSSYSDSITITYKADNDKIWTEIFSYSLILGFKNEFEFMKWFMLPLNKPLFKLIL